ncbi:hypothetical protein LF95_17200 [Thalassospira sp. TSL5-1]|nr:hypothetical protein LF95_17200 [Thalassospira sp. TSL5-1]
MPAPGQIIVSCPDAAPAASEDTLVFKTLAAPSVAVKKGQKPSRAVWADKGVTAKTIIATPPIAAGNNHRSSTICPWDIRFLPMRNPVFVCFQGNNVHVALFLPKTF